MTVVADKRYTYQEAIKITGKIAQKLYYYVKVGIIRENELLCANPKGGKGRKLIKGEALLRIMMFYPN